MAIELLVETSETLKADVLVAGTVPTSGVQFAVLPSANRPVLADWADGVLTDGVWTFPVSGLTKGSYDVWTKVQGSVTRLRNALRVV